MDVVNRELRMRRQEDQELLHEFQRLTFKHRLLHGVAERWNDENYKLRIENDNLRAQLRLQADERFVH